MTIIVSSSPVKSPRCRARISNLLKGRNEIERERIAPTKTNKMMRDEREQQAKRPTMGNKWKGGEVVECPCSSNIIILVNCGVSC